jgi:aspartyl/asparaginyl-tRNA synthetase
MKTMMRIVSLTFVSSLLFSPIGQAAGPTYASLVDQLNPNKNTKLQLKEVWKKYKGEEVAWSGTVVEVKDGRKSATIYLSDTSRKSYDKYNITVSVKDKERAAKLKRGQRIQVKGKLYDFDHHSNGSTTIDLKPGEVL